MQLKVIRHPDPPKTPSRPMKRFSDENKQNGPHHNPNSGGGSTDVSRKAVRTASSPGQIDPNQQHS